MNGTIALAPLASSLEPAGRVVLGLPVTIAMVVGAVLLLLVVLGAVFLPTLRRRNQARGNGAWQRPGETRGDGTWGRR
jgi:hypothetical protein